MMLKETYKKYRELIHNYLSVVPKKRKIYIIIILFIGILIFALLCDIFFISPPAFMTIFYIIIMPVVVVSFLFLMFRLLVKCQTESGEENKITLVEREVEKREKFVQTYIILYGLLLSYNQIGSLQAGAMAWFLPFMTFIMCYYLFLTCIPEPIIEKNLPRWTFVSFVNMFAVISAFYLSVIITTFTYNFDGDNTTYLQPGIISSNMFSSSDYPPVILTTLACKFGSLAGFLNIMSSIIFLTIILSIPLVIHRYAFKK